MQLLKLTQVLINFIFQMDAIDEINESIQAIDQNKPPSHYIGDYAVLDLLGAGAFGSVYRVKKKTSIQSYLAMKEVCDVA